MKDRDNEKPDNELQKSKSHIIVEIVDYVPNSVIDKTIIKKSTGSIRMISFDRGQELREKMSAFDIFIQVIEGNAKVIINHVSHQLKTGQGIIIPAHATGAIRADERFKMIETIIKSGYE